MTHAAELRHVNVTSVILIVVGHDGLEADVGAKEKLRARRRRRRRVGLLGETAQAHADSDPFEKKCRKEGRLAAYKERHSA